MYKLIGADQREYGPFTLEDMRQWIAEGRANAETLIQLEGTTDWKPLASFPELVGALAPLPLPSHAAPPQMSGLPPRSAAAGHVPNYLVPAILSTLCCCLPFGIVAIVYAAQVNSRLAAGDHAGALAASKNAKLWCWISFLLGLAAGGIAFLLGLLGKATSH